MLDIPHVGMPQDVLDAFGHDPSAVTGSTRRLRGWEAVEDIHSRVLRQRDALRRFIYSVEEKTPGPMKSVLDHPIASLTRALENITAQHEEITLKAQEVAKVLQSVKSLHADVKAEYNETLAQTSVVYPEVSHPHSHMGTRHLARFSSLTLLRSRRATRTNTSKCGNSVWTP